MSSPNEKGNYAPIEGPRNLSSDPYASSTIPEPKTENAKFQCPICNRLFNSKPGYYTHARQKHQVGSSISTPIY